MSWEVGGADNGGVDSRAVAATDELHCLTRTALAHAGAWNFGDEMTLSGWCSLGEGPLPGTSPADWGFTLGMLPQREGSSWALSLGRWGMSPLSHVCECGYCRLQCIMSLQCRACQNEPQDKQPV